MWYFYEVDIVVCNVSEGMIWDNYGACLCEVYCECDEWRNAGGEFKWEKCVVFVGIYWSVCKSGGYTYCGERAPRDW